MGPEDFIQVDLTLFELICEPLKKTCYCLRERQTEEQIVNDMGKFLGL
jgi:hypothetical protein